MTLAEKLIAQAASLDTQRLVHESLWDELGSICFPRHGTLSNQRNPSNYGQPDRARMAASFDDTAKRACNTLAHGQASRITPMGSRWFVLRPPGDLARNQAAANWYARCTEILTLILAQSNFYNRAFQSYQHRGGYGISAMEITSGKENRGLHYRTLPIGTYSIAENSMDEVDTVFRTYYRSPSQMVETWGEKGIPAEVRKKFETPDSRHLQTEKVIHAITPRTERDPRKFLDPSNKPIASVHIHADTQTILTDSGFDSMPIAVSRWQTSPNSPYGWGPADYALTEAAQANFIQEMLDVLAETAAFPRILTGSSFKDEIDFSAMGVTQYDPLAGDTTRPQEWLTNGRYDIGKDRLGDKQRAIEQAFFVDLFTAISNLSPTATATQVSAIVSESRELFHPIFANMTKEKLTPLLRRSFSLCLAQGIMPPPPAAVVQGDDISAFIADPDVEFVSAMALALEQTQMGKLNDLIAVLTPLAQVDPTYLDFLNPDTVGAHLSRAQGLPSIFLRTPEQLEALQQARAQAAQAQQAAQASQAVRNLGGVDETAKAAQLLNS